MFDKNNPSTSVTLGRTSYNALPYPDSNKIGTTKTFDTAALSDVALQKEVFAYAEQLAAGKTLASHPTAAGVWNVGLPDGTNINVRTVSSSGVSRWTVEVQNSPSLTGLKSSNKYEIKFK